MTPLERLLDTFPGAEVLDRIENPRRLGNQASLNDQLQWCRRWNGSRPALDVNKVRSERDSYVRHAKKKKWW